MLNSFAIYLVAHFLLYVVVLRKRPVFRSEKGIFLYHFLPALVVALAVLAWAVVARAHPGWPEIVLVLSAHGIYSLSFLELWSLAQGGYSLSIIAAIANAEADRSLTDFSALEAVGEVKQRERLAGLSRLGLIANTDGRVALTERGRQVAALLYRLYAWVHPAEPE